MSEARKKTTRELGRFVVVGGTCTGLDIALHYLLVYKVLLGGRLLSVTLGTWLAGGAPVDVPHAQLLAMPVLKLVTSGLAIIVSFYLNRRYTFEVQAPERARRDFIRFLIVSLVGLLLNSGVFAILGRIAGNANGGQFVVGTILAAGVNAAWNFLGHKLWSFKE